MFLHKINISEFQQKDGTYIIDLGGDPHIGGDHSSEHHFIDFLESPYPKCLMGDLLEAIAPGDRRFSMGAHKNPVINAFWYLKHLLLKHTVENEKAGPVLVLLRGNHEAVIFNKFGNLYQSKYVLDNKEEPVGGLCEDLDILYGGVLCLMVLHDGKGNECEVMLTHGNTSFNYKAGEEERKETNKQVRLRDSLKRICKADLYACGHGHQLVITEPPRAQRLVRNKKTNKMELKNTNVGDRGYYCMCGSFTTVYDEGGDSNYAEDWLVEPTDIGWVRVYMDKNLKVKKVEKIVPDEILDDD